MSNFFWFESCDFFNLARNGCRNSFFFLSSNAPIIFVITPVLLVWSGWNLACCLIVLQFFDANTVSRIFLNRNRIYDRAKFLITGLRKFFIDGRRLPYEGKYSFQCSDWIQIRFIASLWSINKISKMFEKV